MKKSMLYAGIGYLIFGAMCIIIAAITEFRIEGMLWGFGGAGLGPGLVMIWKYAHWTKPENKDEYENMLKQEKIEMSDERKVMIRDKSGGLTYRFMLIVYCVLIMIMSFLYVIWPEQEFYKYAVFGLIGLLAVQYIISAVIFNKINKKY